MLRRPSRQRSVELLAAHIKQSRRPMCSMEHAVWAAGVRNRADYGAACHSEELGVAPAAEVSDLFEDQRDLTSSVVPSNDIGTAQLRLRDDRSHVLSFRPGGPART